MLPNASGTRDLGNNTALWDDVWGDNYHVNSDLVCVTDGLCDIGTNALRTGNIFTDALNLVGTAGSNAEFAGVSKDGGDVAQIQSLYVASNLYIPSNASDSVCTTIDDGHNRFQTTAEELQICSGGTTRLIPSTTTSFTPVTVNCTAGQSLEDPRFENGILVEGSCVTR